MSKPNTTIFEEQQNNASASVDVNVFDSGTCGSNLKWTLSNNYVLTISGTGEMTNWRSRNITPWPIYRSSIIQLIILDGVTSIGNNAFALCENLTNVTIPDSVTSIGDNAFLHCKKLANITIPDSVTSIGNNAFALCENLTNVTIPDSVTSIGKFAFRNCTSLTSVTIGQSHVSMLDSELRDLKRLTNITICGENTAYDSLDGVLFNKDKTELVYCPRGKAGEYVIPGSVTSISHEAFYRCDNLTSVVIPGNLTSISYAFDFCKRLTRITVEENNAVYSSLDGVLFNKNKSELVFCPRGKAGEYIIPSSVISIDNYAFRHCESLTGVTIPNSVTSIGDCAFEYCRNMTSITIPSGVSSIDFEVFRICDGLIDITVDRENAAYASLDGVLFNKNLTELIYCPKGKAGEYTIPDGVTAIGGDAFSDCEKLISVIIPDSVTYIGDYAFSECISLKRVTIPNSVTAIGNCVFSGCERLTDVSIPDSITSIGNYAFSDCWKLKSITIPNSVTSIGDSVFAGCESLTSIYYVGSVYNWHAMRVGDGNDILEHIKLKHVYVPYNATNSTSLAKPKTSQSSQTCSKELRLETGIFKAGKDIPYGLLSLRPNYRPKLSFDYYISQDANFLNWSTHGEFITKAYIDIKEGEYLKLKTYEDNVVIVCKEN